MTREPDTGRRRIDWQDFARALDGVPATLDPGRVKKKSHDYYWFSPILKETLSDKFGDILVTPRGLEDVLKVARTCVEWRAPLTVRGAGTGNYGQAIPLEGGVILDVSKMTAVRWLKPGLIRCEAGILLGAVDAESRKTGWELRITPSTKRTATLGGTIAGGSAGVGSILHGLLRDTGNINGLQVVTMEDEPRVIELRGKEIQQANHAYGTNGIITELEVPLAPAYPWADLIVAFDGLMTAARFGQALGDADGIVKNECSVCAWPIPKYLKPLRGFIPEGKTIAICMVAEQSLEPFETLVADFGGEICYRKSAEEVASGTPLFEYTWNHTTLYAIKADPSITYLQALFKPGRNLERIEHVADHFGDEMPIHLEFIRLHGQVGCMGVVLLRYRGESRLNEVIEYLEDYGVPVFNPHTPILEDGGMKMVNRAQLDFKKLADPYGLLNPGKMRAWMEDREVLGKEDALYPADHSGGRTVED